MACAISPTMLGAARTKLWSSTPASNLELQSSTFQPLRHAGVSVPAGALKSVEFPRSGTRKLFSTTSVVVPICAAAFDVPTVSETKAAFLAKYRKPIPNIYNNVIQELIVQQHLFRYNSAYKYDAIFALGFVTVYDQLMDGFPSDEDRQLIFSAYIEALSEDPVSYRSDAQAVEEWASSLNPSSILEFSSRDTPTDKLLQDIAERSKTGKFYYSRLFAIGLFRILELASASEPSVLENLSNALGLRKISIDRDLGVYRSLLNKLTQSKELLKDFLEREKKQALLREKEKVVNSE